MSAESPATDEPSGKDASLAEKKITELAKIGVPLGTISIAAIAGAVQGPPAAILVLAGGALVGVIAVFWASVRTLLGETPLSGADAYALGAPRAEEEQKRAVLRALKDLEFERSVGKISEEDYQALVAKYRAEAKRLLRILDADAGPRREQVESLVQRRLRREGLEDVKAEEVVEEAPEDATAEDAKPAEDAEDAAKPARAKAKKRKRERAAQRDEEAAPKAAKPAIDHEEAASGAKTRACAACSTANDLDAMFCKKCGARVGQPTEDAANKEEGAS